MKRQQSVRRLAQAVGGLLLVGSQDRAGSVGRDGTAVVRQLGHSGITLDDLEAIGAARARALEAVRVLREHKLRRAPAGGVRAHTLVVGPRGCGKSLLAQAIAGQAGVPLFWLAGREVTKLPIGRAAAAVADLFARAVTSAPCLVLIEDLDVVAQADRGRGAELAGAPVVLKQILAELDRLGRSDVVVFGTACEPDVLEEAVRGPGRFERQATLERPDQLGRFQILRLHTSAMKLADDVDLQALAGRRGRPGPPREGSVGPGRPGRPRHPDTSGFRRCARADERSGSPGIVGSGPWRAGAARVPRSRPRGRGPAA